MIKLGIIGLSEGNGHPYSWSAIFNGYDKEKMAGCPFPVIPKYLAERKPEDFGIEGAKVTHVWTQDRDISRRVAEASLIPHVADNITDMVSLVDAVILARDDGERHLEMAKPFIEAGLPVFIDKPLTTGSGDLQEFVKYYRQGRLIVSCSSMRYAGSVIELKEKQYLDRIVTANGVTPKYWRTYGIHMIEGISAVMGGGVESVQNVGEENKDIVHIRYRDGRHAVIQAFAETTAGHLSFYGTGGGTVLSDESTFWQFKRMLAGFVEALKTGKSPFPWEETVETIKIVIAGIISLKEGNRVVYLKEIIP